jgi:hypothetical protein
MRLPLLMPAPSKLERAGDPEVACVEADDLVAGVKDAPVARPRTPQRDRFDVTSWCYTITGRRHGLPVALSTRQGSTHPALRDARPSSTSPFRQCGSLPSPPTSQKRLIAGETVALASFLAKRPSGSQCETDRDREFVAAMWCASIRIAR